ncbi:MAG: sigma-70 family RNA polymerase sigma factor [Firmicutes bacterium]|nr:sigma-70 family RNA polymerase sigma factor [Alicyclobacillaceae bacterium]MCL6498130.1 sigma-70 family RNA polymerase sigma factor [Bacillota bacterium]
MNLATTIAGCLMGRADAWETLVNTFSPRAHRVAQQLCRDETLADDVVQSSWLTAFQHLRELREPEAFPGWFLRIVRTQAYRMLQTPGPTHVLSDAAVSVDRLDEAWTLQADVDRILAAMPVALSQVFFLAGIYGWPLRDVARFLAMPEGTVKSRLARARQQIQAQLGDAPIRFASESGSWDRLLRAMARGPLPTADTVRRAVAERWAGLHSLRFTVRRTWAEPHREQTVAYAWRRPNWLRWETATPEMGRVVTVVHGRQMRMWWERTGVVTRDPLPRAVGLDDLLMQLWRRLPTHPGLVVLPPGEYAAWWHVWWPLEAEASEASVHVWVDPVDGWPHVVEVWRGHTWTWRAEVTDLEKNPGLTRRDFLLPCSNSGPRPFPRLQDALGGVGREVPRDDVSRRCPFPLMGLDPAILAQLGVPTEPQVYTYYRGTEWMVRYGPAVGHRPPRGLPLVHLWQAAAPTAAVRRHWRVDGAEDAVPAPELGPAAHCREVMGLLPMVSVYWEHNGRPFRLMAFHLPRETVLNLASHLVPWDR